MLDRQENSLLGTQNRHLRSKTSFGDRVSLLITQRVGSIQFFFVIFLWTTLWIGWNSLAPKALRFDPSPDFLLWLFISNVIQIMLMPLIMVDQNLQGTQDRMRARAVYETGLKVDRKVEKLSQQLVEQQREIAELKQLLKRQQELFSTRAIPPKHTEISDSLKSRSH